MILNNDLIERFQSVYLEKFGVIISYTIAEAQLKELAELVRLTSTGELLS